MRAPGQRENRENVARERILRSIAGAGIVLALLAQSATLRAQPAPEPGPAPPPKPEPQAPPEPLPEKPLPAKEPAPPPKEQQERPVEKPVEPPPPIVAAPPQKHPESGFAFGSYGRVIAATDLKGRPGRDADVVAHGSRLDESNYVELELRRDDYWSKTDSTTRLVATLAVGNPIFHYNGDFNVKLAVRNLYLESRDLLAKGLSIWAGSRMYRGDDIYLLDWWPLDNLNTLGAGVKYDLDDKTSFALHGGASQPANGFYEQSVDRPLVFNQFGTTSVAVLDRERFTGSAKVTRHFKLGADGAGIKAIAYGEVHSVPGGQREAHPGDFEEVPADKGFVVGAQLGAYSGKRDTHINLFLRYATGIAAYPDFAAPTDLANDKTTSGAHELVVALGGNYEYGPVGVMLGGYVRSFRNSSPDLDFNDLDEGIVVVRPHVFFGEIGGLALEGSYQAQQRGVLIPAGTDGAPADAKGPLTARLWRFGVIPFVSPAGRGDYSRPHFRLIYALTVRNQAAQALYPLDDVFSLRKTEHFLGIGAEWWFNSSSYGG